MTSTKERRAAIARFAPSRASGSRSFRVKISKSKKAKTSCRMILVDFRPRKSESHLRYRFCSPWCSHLVAGKRGSIRRLWRSPRWTESSSGTPTNSVRSLKFERRRTRRPQARARRHAPVANLIEGPRAMRGTNSEINGAGQTLSDGFDDRPQSRRLGDRACLGDSSSSRLT